MRAEAGVHQCISQPSATPILWMTGSGSFAMSREKRFSILGAIVADLAECEETCCIPVKMPAK
jgi:hypothetical protein